MIHLPRLSCFPDAKYATIRSPLAVGASFFPQLHEDYYLHGWLAIDKPKNGYVTLEVCLSAEELAAVKRDPAYEVLFVEGEQAAVIWLPAFRIDAMAVN